MQKEMGERRNSLAHFFFKDAANEIQTRSTKTTAPE